MSKTFFGIGLLTSIQTNGMCVVVSWELDY